MIIRTASRRIATRLYGSNDDKRVRIRIYAGESIRDDFYATPAQAIAIGEALRADGIAAKDWRMKWLMDRGFSEEEAQAKLAKI